APIDFIQHVVIQLGALLGLVGVGYVLTQVVDADAGAPAVDHLCGPYRVLYRHAGDEALRKAQAHRRVLREVTQPFAFGQSDEERSQHEALQSSGELWDWGAGVGQRRELAEPVLRATEWLIDGSCRLCGQLATLLFITV